MAKKHNERDYHRGTIRLATTNLVAALNILLEKAQVEKLLDVEVVPFTKNGTKLIRVKFTNVNDEVLKQ